MISIFSWFWVRIGYNLVIILSEFEWDLSSIFIDFLRKLANFSWFYYQKLRSQPKSIIFIFVPLFGWKLANYNQFSFNFWGLNPNPLFQMWSTFCEFSRIFSWGQGIGQDLVIIWLWFDLNSILISIGFKFHEMVIELKFSS